jgi:hypothetical protein
MGLTLTWTALVNVAAVVQAQERLEWLRADQSRELSVERGQSTMPPAGAE